MISLFARRLSPCLLAACTLLPGCSSLARGAFERSTQVVVALDDAWLDRCLSEHADLENDQRPWVVAVLSPRMAYSLLEWPRMQRAAIDMGFRVKTWQDPLVPVAEWQSALANAQNPGWESIKLSLPPVDCLAGWLPIDHFPYVRVLLGGRVHAWPIWGVMPDQAWRVVLGNRVGSLKHVVREPH